MFNYIKSKNSITNIHWIISGTAEGTSRASFTEGSVSPQ
jgi:hypothetical protein